MDHYGSTHVQKYKKQSIIPADNSNKKHKHSTNIQNCCGSEATHTLCWIIWYLMYK